MPKATEQHSTSTLATSGRKVGRRALALAGGAFAAVGLIAGAAASMPSPGGAAAASVQIDPDKAVIELCEQFDGVERAYRAIYDSPDAIADDDAAEAASKKLGVEMNALLDELQQVQAVTPAGILARAKTLAIHNPDFEFSFDDPQAVSGRLLSYLLRDAASLAGAVTDKPYQPSPDLLLLSLCVEAVRADDQCRGVDDRIGGLERSDPSWVAGQEEICQLMAIYRNRVARVADIQAQTPIGLRAKAALAKRDIGNAAETGSLVSSLLSDMLGRA